MKVAFCADVHLGNHRRFGGEFRSSLNERCRCALASLEAAVDLALREEAEDFVVLGDLFDDAKPPPQLLAEVRRIFAKGRGLANFWLLVGNHDQVSSQPGDHALGPLEDEHVRVVEEPTVVSAEAGDLVLLPFRAAPASEWLAGEVASLLRNHRGDRPRALCVHLGVADGDTPPWLVGAPDSAHVDELVRVAAANSCAAAFAGNWHSPRFYLSKQRPCVIQAGALVPTGFDNPGFDYGHVVFWDGKKIDVDRYVSGPRFVHLRDSAACSDALEEARESGHALFVRVTTSADRLAEFTRFVETLSANNEIAAGEVGVDAKEVEGAARMAAAAARSASTLEDAVEKYVASMPLADGVDRAKVAARARGYLGIGG